MRAFLGVDPGASGASVIVLDGEPPKFVYHSETEAEISNWYELILRKHYPVYAMIEKVSAMPKQGVSSTFKFGQSFGFLRGLLTAHKIPFELVSPVKWQNALQCRTGGDKNITKAKASQLCPSIKWTHKTADAYLLAEYARRFGGWKNV